jgi:hypothetical protein
VEGGVDPRRANAAAQTLPRVNAVVWFNWRIDGDDSEIESSASSQAAFAVAVASPYHASGGGFRNLPLLGKIKPLE